MGGPLELKEIQQAQNYGDDYKRIRQFVETGTYKGDTTIMVSKHFDHVYTTEIVPQLYNFSSERAKKEGRTNITFLLGDSVELLKQIVMMVKTGAVFFIDAHQSGPDTSNNGKNVPLLEELEVILNGKIGPSVFIFDDTRFWAQHNQEAWDWKHISISKILGIFAEHDYLVEHAYEQNDRLYVLARYLTG